MVRISNSPAEATVIRAEARKSFALGVQLLNANSDPVDLTGVEFSLVVAQMDRYENVTELLSKSGTVVDAAHGWVRFYLQAAELELEKGSYPMVVTMLSGGYSTVLMKGLLEITPNVEFSSVGQEYTLASPPKALEIVLKQQADVHIRLGSSQPPDAVRVPPGGTTGQALVKKSNSSFDLVWSSLEGGLAAEGVPVGFAPVSNGDDTWDWRLIPSQTDLENIALTISDLESDIASINSDLSSVWTAIASLGETLTEHSTELTAQSGRLDSLETDLPKKAGVYWGELVGASPFLVQIPSTLELFEVTAGRTLVHPDSLRLGDLVQISVHGATVSILGRAEGNEGFRPGRTVVFTASGEFKKADYPRLRAIRVRLVGAGGGGGGAPATGGSVNSSGAGGGGGGYAESFITALGALPASVPVTVGLGGNGGGGGTGATGGSSSFGDLVEASGGGGGYAKSADAYSPYITAGGGGLGVLGDIQISGSGGGVGAGYSSLASGGPGGSSQLGGGGQAVGTGAGGAGLPGAGGRPYGGGGGGAMNNSGASVKVGGRGGDGVVLIDLFY